MAACKYIWCFQFSISDVFNFVDLYINLSLNGFFHDILHTFYKYIEYCHQMALFSLVASTLLKNVTWVLVIATIPKLKNWLTLSWRRSLSNRNQSIDLPSKSMDWFLYDNGLRHERVKVVYRVLNEWKYSKLTDAGTTSIDVDHVPLNLNFFRKLILYF